MIEYDIECKLTFIEPIEEEVRRAFKATVEGHRAGWYGARPVVAWGTMTEATVYFLARGEAPGADDAVAQALCDDAAEQIRGWANQAGLPELSGEGASLRCQADPRI